MKLMLALAIGAITVLLFIASCDDDEGPSPTPSPTPTTTATAPPNVCLPNPDPATPDQLVIDAPEPNDAVTSPVTVSGQIAAFEAAFKLTIYDAAANQIANVNGLAEEGQVLSPFSEQVNFSVTTSTPACLWVYTLNAADGSIQDVGQVPIMLLP